CPSVSSSSGGRNRTCVPPVNSRALVPARTPPESSSSDRQKQSGWPDSNRRFPAPEAGGLARLSYIPSDHVLAQDKCPAGVEPAHPPWQGGRLPLHHGHVRRPRIVKEPRAPGGTRTHVSALRERSLRR